MKWLKSLTIGILFWITYSSGLLVLSETKLSKYLDLFKFLKFGVALSLMYISGSFVRGLFARKQKVPEEKPKDETDSSKEQEEIFQNNSTQPEEIHTLAPLPSIQGSSIIEQIRDVD